MRIGFIQCQPGLGMLDANRDLVESLVRAAPPADLFVLPELVNSGYHFATPEAAHAASEDPTDGPFAALLRRLARERDCAFVAGLCERDGAERYNSAIFVTAEGTIAVYRKLHLFWNERDLFRPGDAGLPLVDWRGVRTGMLICFDWRFPEVWQALALAGCDVVAHPSNLVVPGLCQRVIPTHALLHRFHVVTANRIGEERGLAFTGRSLIVDARGEVLAEAPADAPDVQVRELDPALSRDKQATPRNDLHGDRRPDFYTVRPFPHS